MLCTTSPKKILLASFFIIMLAMPLIGMRWYQLRAEKEIVVIIPSYNNQEWYERNLRSVFNQNYHRYRIVYINDCSNDNTAKLVNNLVTTAGQQHRTVIKNNSKRLGALHNLYHAILPLPDQAIVITLDGDDWLKGDNVFATINQAYQDRRVWMTFGQYETYPDCALGICHELPATIVSNHAYRMYDWVTSHLRTFRAGLFKRIKKEDLMINGKFFDVAWDQAFLFPMLEMAAGHYKFINQILYVYNQANQLNDFKQKAAWQDYCGRYIRSKKRYHPLDRTLAYQWAR